MFTVYLSMSSGEEGEVEEGQLVATPGDGSRTSTPGDEQNRHSKSPRMGRPFRVTTRKSRSKSPTKNRNRSRSRSVDRSKSRDGRRRGDRQGSRSGSRDSYHGPIIRDMRRGRGGRHFKRFIRGGPRGNRGFGRRDRDRFHSRSRSKSWSGSPRRDRRPPVTSSERISPLLNQEEISDSQQPKGAQPSDIKNLSKAETSSFLAMLQQKKVNKLIPINIKSKNPENEGSHGFVSTFATVGQKNASQNSSRFSADVGGEAKEDIVARDDTREVKRTGEQGKGSASNGTRKRSSSKSSSDQDHSSRKKPKKHKHRKKSKKRKKNESDSESDGDKKKSKRKSGDGSDDKKDSSKDDTKRGDEKKKDRKKKRKRRHRSSSESSEQKKSSKKKSKKLRSEKKKKRRKRSSSESDSSDNQNDGKSEGKKKAEKSSKSTLKSPLAKIEDLETPVVKSSVSSQMANFNSREDDLFEFPRSISKYTKTLPSLQYCHNPRTLLMDPSSDLPLKAKVTIPLDDPKPTKENRDRKEKTEASNKVRDSSAETLTPSERRSLEKKKKEEQKRSVEGIPVIEKSEAASNYYRSKKDSKSERGVELVEKEQKKDDKKLYEERSSNKKISKSVESSNDRTKQGEPEESIEEKKKKLLEKVREKKEVVKSDGDRIQKRIDISSMIGKIPKKKGPVATIRDPINMNNDYGYYQQNYIYNYGYDVYTAAYYAQYVMVTSGDYSQEEIKRWLESNGYKYDYTTGQEMPQLPPTDTSEAMEPIPSDKEGQPIAVIVPNVPAAAHEMYYQSPQSDSMDVDSDDGGVTPPNPPPPPPEPQITTLTVTEPFSLPDGSSIPSGTKQVIVHPYSDTHPFASEFTPDAIKSKVQSIKQSNEECS